MKTRQELIKAGKIWQVSPDGKPEQIDFEGPRTKCLQFIRAHFGMSAYKTGRIRLGEVIFELPQTP